MYPPAPTNNQINPHTVTAMNNNIDVEDAAATAFECTAALHHALLQCGWNTIPPDSLYKYTNKVCWMDTDNNIHVRRREMFLEFLVRDDHIPYTLRKKGLQAEINLLVALVLREHTGSMDSEARQKLVDYTKTQLQPEDIVAKAQENAENILATAEMLWTDNHPIPRPRIGM